VVRIIENSDNYITFLSTKEHYRDAIIMYCAVIVIQMFKTDET
jgi:hypothetical protein